MKSMLRPLGLLAALVVLATCGGGGGSSNSVAVSISPPTAALHPGDIVPFSASVTGSGDSSVIWAVQEGAAGGSVDTMGNYQAPIHDGTYHVIATSRADSSETAVATITVFGPFLITPASDVLGPSGVRGFSATVKVTWSVQEGATGGAITTDGMYTAPASLGTYHVVATSVEDTSISVTADVTVVASGFVATGNMSIGRTAHTATLLQNGKVLIAGGDSCYTSSYYSNSCPLDSAELYDPVAGTFTVTGAMAAARYFHTATLLGSGKVLLAGGADASAEIYDPATGKFTATGSMTMGRTGHTATLLNNGRVLIAGGSGVGGAIATAELYDPATGKFTATGSLNQARDYHGASLLPNGNVLIEGGWDATNAVLSTAEIYDAIAGTFTAVNGMTGKRTEFNATLLANSNVLVTGGTDGQQSLATAEVYDDASGRFTATGPMKVMRSDHVATLLTNGKVLVAGSDFTAELYDAASGTFIQTGGMLSARQHAAAVLLQDGRVLVTGGSDANTAELYQ